MKKKAIVILAVLGIIGLVIALAFVGSVTYIMMSSEPWEELPYWKLTDEERQTAYDEAILRPGVSYNRT
jgi:acyl-CoA synthetase (AMP-forming)/AMP-acid ligase II